MPEALGVSRASSNQTGRETNRCRPDHHVETPPLGAVTPAVDMAATLRRLGFEVTTERVELTDALRAFTAPQRRGRRLAGLLRGPRTGDGRRQLPGAGRRALERDVDVRYETLTLDDLLVSTLGARLRLVILDACRNNPLARSMQRTLGSRSRLDDLR